MQGLSDQFLLFRGVSIGQTGTSGATGNGQNPGVSETNGAGGGVSGGAGWLGKGGSNADAEGGSSSPTFAGGNGEGSGGFGGGGGGGDPTNNGGGGGGSYLDPTFTDIAYGLNGSNNDSITIELVATSTSVGH